MVEYSRLFGSNFPNEAITLTNYKDINDATEEVKNLIVQFYTFMDAGNIASASALYESNKEILAPYYVGMEHFNKWEEEIYNAEQYVLNSSTTAVSTDEPNIDDYPLYSSWLKPIE